MSGFFMLVIYYLPVIACIGCGESSHAHGLKWLRKETTQSTTASHGMTSQRLTGKRPAPRQLNETGQ
ncbi:hypothetical protein S839_25530 [Salmonella enterica]|nr:hypothetical protein [Salmonella enterica]